jgi:hypothetical protein
MNEMPLTRKRAMKSKQKEPSEKEKCELLLVVSVPNIRSDLKTPFALPGGLFPSRRDGFAKGIPLGAVKYNR